MKVILTDNVKKVGSVGEIVNVSTGFARNYLIPKKFAVVADERNSNLLEEKIKRLGKKINERLQFAGEIKKKLDGFKLEINKKVGGSGRIFGTVTMLEIASALEAKEIEVEKKYLTVDRPIKSLGTYDVKAKLFKDVEATFQVIVVIDPKQAEELKAKAASLAKSKKNKKKVEKEKEKVESESEAEVTNEEA